MCEVFSTNTININENKYIDHLLSEAQRDIVSVNFIVHLVQLLKSIVTNESYKQNVNENIFLFNFNSKDDIQEREVKLFLNKSVCEYFVKINKLPSRGYHLRINITRFVFEA